MKKAPTYALHILTDGITPQALANANTPNLDALIQRGASATDARGVFPTITGPSHTSMLTGARVGTHGFLYPKMLDAYGNRLLEFSEGLMRAETIAEAWRPRGITTAGIGSRFFARGGYDANGRRVRGRLFGHYQLCDWCAERVATALFARCILCSVSSAARFS